MKKIISLASAAAILAGAAALPANASYSGYMPVLYFETDKSDSYDILPGGKVYINTNDFTGDTLTVTSRVYIDDERDNAGIVTVKWQSADEHIVLSGLTDPFKISGGCPYAEFKKASEILMDTNTGNNMQAVTYNPGISYIYAMTFTGTASNDYPLAGFDAVIDSSVSYGDHEICFMTDYNDRCNILYRNDEDLSIDMSYPSGDHTKNLKIAVSDRDPGDVDNSGKIEATDASQVLAAYANLSSGGASGLTPAETAAADVNGDCMISAVDASYILNYYTYLSSSGTLDMAEYLEDMNV